MRRIRGIIESSIEPNTTDCIWIKGDEIKYHTNGRWTDVGESKEDRKELEEKVDNLDKEVGDLKGLGEKVDNLGTEVEDLKELGKVRGIKGISTMNKAEVVEAMLLMDEKEKDNAQKAENEATKNANESPKTVAEATKPATETPKMMKRSKAIENRQQDLIHEKSKLLKNLETAESLKLSPLPYHTSRLLELSDVSIAYGSRAVCSNISFTIEQGDRIALQGKNGSGKSSILKLICGENIPYQGILRKSERLPALAVVAALLHVSDRWAEQRRSVLLCHGEQCEFIPPAGFFKLVHSNILSDDAVHLVVK